VTDSHDTKALAIIPKSITELTTLAELLAKSDLLPKALRGKVPDVAMTILAGQEMGLTPMAALRNFHVIEGKPVMSADGMVALALGSGKAVYFRSVEESAEIAIWETFRVGAEKPQRCTWTKQMAKDAGLSTKDNWRLYPRAMLAARAKAELARNVYPDVLAGCAATEEVGDWVQPRNVDAVDAEFVDVPADVEPMPMELQALEHTKTEAECKEYAKVLAKLPEKWRAKANDLYKARLAWHRANPATEVQEVAS
jgi:hypothetical protein